jgi:hypothetical protein
MAFGVAIMVMTLASALVHKKDFLNPNRKLFLVAIKKMS